MGEELDVALASSFLLLCSRVVGDAPFLGSVFTARLHGGGAGCREVLGFKLWLLPFALFESSIGYAHLLGLFAQILA